MKKMSFLFLSSFCLFSFSLGGCGGGDNTVIEAPAVEEDTAAMPGMTDEEYDKAMDAEMQ